MGMGYPLLHSLYMPNPKAMSVAAHNAGAIHGATHGEGIRKRMSQSVQDAGQFRRSFRNT